MNKLIAAAALVAATAAAPALAVTYDAFTSFNGTNGNGNFNYGYTDGTTLTAFDTSGGCVFGSNSTCLRSTAQGVLPQASVGGSLASGTVAFPTSAIVVHPGDSAALSDYAGFVATNTGSYSYTINLESVGRDTTNGTGYRTFTALGGTVTSLGARSLLSNFGATGTLTGTQTLALGETFGVIVDYNGGYGGDSTGLNFSVSDGAGAVPEPAMWGLMIAGFGLVGTSMRRRARTAVAA